MSYINEALKKAQKEKDILYRRYREFLDGQKSNETGRKKSRWKIPVIVTTLCILIVGIAATYFLQDKKSGGNESFRHAIVQKETAPSKQTEKPADAQAPPPMKMKPSHSPKQSDPVPMPPSNAPGNQLKSLAQAPATNIPKPPSTTPSQSTGMSQSKDSSPSAIDEKSSQQQNQAPVITPPATATSDPQQLYQQALAYQRTNNLNMAERLYLRTLKVDPRFVSAMNNLGVIYMSQNKYQNAQQLFQNAITIDNNYVDPYYNLACIYTLSGNTTEGLSYLKKAIALKKDVKNWAKNDKDLNKLRYSPEFAELIGTSATVSPETQDIYIVKKDEWVFDIVRKHYGVSDAFVPDILKLIKDLNPELINSDVVYPGQKLLIPPKENIKKLVSEASKTDRK